jgi:hypothetical protein
MKPNLFLVVITTLFVLLPAQAQQTQRPLFRPNSFMLQSFQAGSTTELDNLKVIDLDSNAVVYNNAFEQSEDATRNLRLLYWPDGGRDTTNYFLNNSTFTRIENGKLILETTGFNQNGNGGYDSHTDAEFTGTLPKNFLIEFEARRLQWPGHFNFLLYRSDASDSQSGTHTSGGAFSQHRNSNKPVDYVVVTATGHWFRSEFGVVPDGMNNGNFQYSAQGPYASLLDNHKLGLALQDGILTFYLDDQIVNSITIQEWSLQQDSDGDGVKDGQEIDDGTDPYDSSSLLVWNFNFSPSHVNDTGADYFLLSNHNVRKYTEWQNPPITYWGPMENNIEGNLVYKFPFDGVAKRIRLKARDSSWDFFGEFGGYGRGCSLVEASRDGLHWVVLRNSLEPRLWGEDWYIDEDLPKQLTGTSELWFRVRMLTEYSPNSFYSVAQFGRSTSEATEPFFSVKAVVVDELSPSADQDGDGLSNAQELALKTNPFERDTDGDGITDFREVGDLTNPINPDSFNPLSRGLVAFYPFNGNAIDESGNGNSGVIHGAVPTFNRFGNSNSAFYFDGVDDFINLGDKQAFDFGYSNFSITAWVQSTASNSGTYIIGKYNSGAESSYGLGTDGEGFVYSFIVDSLPYADVRGSTQFRDTLWHNITAVFNRNSYLNIYVDGMLESSIDISCEAGYIGNDFPLFIGKILSGQHYSGKIDDIRIYNRDLNPEEVSQIYEQDLVSIDSDQDGISDSKEIGFERYALVRGNFTWSEAKADAESRGGHLGTITSSAEYDFLTNLLGPNPGNGEAWWLGATDAVEEGNWKWVTGEPWSYQAWFPGEPNNGSLSTGNEDVGQITWNDWRAWNDVADELNSGYTVGYLLEFGYPTDPFNPDTDGDGLSDGVETGSGSFISDENTGTNPLLADTNSDGFTDGEAVLAGLNPLTDFASVIALMKQLSTTSPGRFDLYTTDAIMDMNMGALTIQKVGSVAKVDLQLQTTTNLATQPFTNLGEPIEVQVEMPGDKGFIRVHALGSN